MRLASPRHLALLAGLLLASTWAAQAARPTELGIEEPNQPTPTQPAGQAAPTPAPEAAAAPAASQLPAPPPPAPEAAAPLPTAAPITEPPASPATPPSPPAAGGPRLQQCALLPNTNARGNGIKELRGLSSVADCCNACLQTQGCNVFVFCPTDGGCDNGAGQFFPKGICTLKAQQLAAGQQPKYFAQGPVVTWSSGYLPSS